MEELKAILKSCIISRKGGIPLQELNDDYKELAGESIPFKKMGYSTLEGFLKSTDGITLKLGVVHAASTNSSHIEKLISRQKTVPKKHNNKFKNVHKVHPYKHKENVNNMENVKSNKPNKRHDEFNAYFYQTLKKDNKYNKEFKKLFSNYDRSRENSPTNVLDCIDYYKDFDSYKYYYNQQCETFKLALWLGITLMHDRRDLRIRDGGFHCESIWINALKNERRVMRSRKFSPFVIGNHQVIGDDFMVEVAHKGYNERYFMDGPCVLGLTLKKAQIAALDHVYFDNVLICCGTIDVHMNLSLNTLISDMQQLLLCIVLSGRMPVVCNIPPTTYSRHDETIRLFNDWLSSLTFIRIIDLHSLFICPHRNVIKSDMFQRQPTHMDYCQPIYYWSRLGISEVKKCINNGLSRQFYM